MLQTWSRGAFLYASCSLEEVGAGGRGEGETERPIRLSNTPSQQSSTPQGFELYTMTAIFTGRSIPSLMFLLCSLNSLQNRPMFTPLCGGSELIQSGGQMVDIPGPELVPEVARGRPFRLVCTYEPWPPVFPPPSPYLPPYLQFPIREHQTRARMLRPVAKSGRPVRGQWT